MPGTPNMTPQMRQIMIQSILGGQSKYENYAAEDEFTHSYAIDPDIANAHNQSEGVISPAGLTGFAGGLGIATTPNAPLWIVPNPKNANIYVYGHSGSVWTLDMTSYALQTVSGGDLTDGGTASGNGAAYYDNYVYFARDTTIARYGPLNGAPVWTDDYWVTTLAKTALVHTTYPSYAINALNLTLPNHILHRHTDGRLYFGDVVGNQGYLHFISTTKTTVEGDTDNGSTYAKLSFPYGFWPTAIASYGVDLAVALYEGSDNQTTFQRRAKLAFWDTTSTNYNTITEVEFPDPVIFALLNTNGVLYTFSGQINKQGVRICRFTGGYTFEQVAFLDYAYPPLAGAVDGYLNRVIFGSRTKEPNPVSSSGSQLLSNTYLSASVFGIGSKKSPISSAIFNIMGASSTASAASITAAAIAEQAGLNLIKPLTGWTDGTTHGMDTQSSPVTDLNGQPILSGLASSWRSQVFRIGKKFKIVKIRIPFANQFTATMRLIVGIYRDSFSYAADYVKVGDFTGDSTTPPRALAIRPVNLTGEHRFMLELFWPGSDFVRVSLPIVIDIELIDD